MHNKTSDVHDCGVPSISVRHLMVPKRGRRFGLVGGNHITNNPHVSSAGGSAAGNELPAARERDSQVSIERLKTHVNVG